MEDRQMYSIDPKLQEEREEHNRSVLERDRRMAEKYTPHSCPDCGSQDGMESWLRFEMECLPDELLRDIPWYRLPALPDRIFAQCSSCFGDVPETYIPMTVEEVQAWMAR